MLNVEISELMNTEGKMATWANKVKANIELSAEEKEISSVVDAWAKKIGSGEENAYALSQYLVKTVQPEVYNAPDEILDSLFERGSIGEFDNFQINEDAKNTLNVIESAKNGNVDKSYIDYSKVLPTWKHMQIETEVSMEKLRKGGYKTVADLQIMAEEAFKNKMFYTVFSMLDSAIVTPIATCTGNALNMSAMDDASSYLLDRADNPVFIGLSSLIRPVYKMNGYSAYLTEDMKGQINKYGILGAYNGVKLVPISAAKKLGDGTQIFPSGKVLGIAGKVGELDMRGDLRIYPIPDYNREVIGLKMTGFEFGLAINAIDKVCKISITA